MNLELKHLTPYLPYDLKGISKDENLGIEIVKGYSTYGNNRGICLTTNVDDIDIEGFLPILRPLSDLTKDIEVNGERFVPIKKLQSVFSKRLRFDEDGFYNHDEVSMVNRGGDKIFTFNQLDAYSFLFERHLS